MRYFLREQSRIFLKRMKKMIKIIIKDVDPNEIPEMTIGEITQAEIDSPIYKRG